MFFFFSELPCKGHPKELSVNIEASFSMWCEIQACLNHCHVLVVEQTERRAQLSRSKYKIRHISASPRCLDCPNLQAIVTHCLEIHLHSIRQCFPRVLICPQWNIAAQRKQVKMNCGRMIWLVDGIPERCCHCALKVKNPSKISFLLNKGTLAQDDELIG